MNDTLKKIIKYALSLGVAVILLWFCFQGVNWADFLNGLLACRWEFVALSMLSGLVAFLFRAFRWRRIMLPVDPTVDRLTVFNAINIGNISNFIFQYLGEFVRTGIIISHSRSASDETSERKGVSTADGGEIASTTDGGKGVASEVKENPRYDRILGTVVLERGWDIISLLILFAILLACKWADFGSFFKVEIWDRFTGRFSTGTWWLAGGAVVIVLALVVEIYLLRRRVKAFGKICSALKGLFQGVGSCLKMDHKWLFFLYTSAIWGCYWLMMVFMIQAFPGTADAGLNLVDALFLMLVGSIASFIPVPGGFGAYHFLVSAALATIYGFTKADGMIFATIAHESQAVNMVILGLISYLIEMIRTDRQAGRNSVDADKQSGRSGMDADSNTKEDDSIKDRQ